MLPSPPSRAPASLDSRVSLPLLGGARASTTVAAHDFRSRATAPADGGPELQRYFGVLRRRWRLVAGVVGGLVAAVAVGTALQSPRYRASGLMELRGQSGEGVPVEALFQAQRLSNQFLETQYGVLRSTALARRTMRDLGLLTPAPDGARAVATVSTPAGPSDEMDVDRRVNAFAHGLIVDPVDGSNLVWVHYESPDPQFAARVVNAVFDSYTDMRAEAAHDAITRLTGEVDSVRGRLTYAERSLQDYVRKHGLTVVPPSGGGETEDLPRARLRVLQQQLAEADADRYNKESLHDLARASGDGLLESEILQALHVRLASLQSEYARLRATFLDDYPRTREVKGQIDEVQGLLAREQGRLRGAIADRYQAAARRQQLLQRAVDEQRSLVDGQSESATQYRMMARDVEAQQELYSKLQERLRGAEVSAAVATSDVSVVQAAIAPGAPLGPHMSTNLGLALVAGLTIGVGLAFLREYVDITVRSADDLATLTVPVLGLIPSVPRSLEQRVPSWARPMSGRLAALHPAETEAERTLRRGALKDAFLGLRTSVLLATGESCSARSLLVTSSQPGEGKSTIAVNLALSLGGLGRRVLLIDADMRRPAVHRAFSLDAGPGLGDALYGVAPWESYVRRTAAPGLDLLLAGHHRAEPTELLASPGAAALLAEANERYDFVVVDSPALGINAADTRILASYADGVVIVVRSGTTPRAVVDALLRQAPNVVGVVLNDVDQRQLAPYYYAYGETPAGATTLA